MSGQEPQEGVAQIDNALVVNTDPDWCFVDEARTAVPFKIAAKFLDDDHPAMSVMYHGMAASNSGTRISYCIGNEEGVFGGIFSGVHNGWCRPVEGSSSVVVEGQAAMRHGDPVWMNCAGPNGTQNTRGIIIYVLEDRRLGIYWWDNPHTGLREMVHVGIDSSVLGDDGQPMFDGRQRPQWSFELPTDPADYRAMEQTAAFLETVGRVLSNPWVAGPLQIIGGIGEIAIAAPMVTVGIAEPVTTAAGVVIILHGSDSIAAGINTLATGEVQPTVTEQVIGIGLMQAGMNPEQAVFLAGLADGGLGMVLGGAGVVRIAGQADDVLRNTYRMSDEFIENFLRSGPKVDALVPEEAGSVAHRAGTAADEVMTIADETPPDVGATGSDGMKITGPTRSVEATNASVMDGANIAPDGYVYRTVDSEYVQFDPNDPTRGQLPGHDNPTALVRDVHGEPVSNPLYEQGLAAGFSPAELASAGFQPTIAPHTYASQLDNAYGWNVAANPGSVQGYSGTGHVTVRIRVQDIVDAGGIWYPDVGAAISNAVYITAPPGTRLPFEVVSP